MTRQMPGDAVIHAGMPCAHSTASWQGVPAATTMGENLLVLQPCVRMGAYVCTPAGTRVLQPEERAQLSLR